MKKLFAIITATFVAFTANAQISSSTSRTIHTTVEQEQYEVTYGKTYNRFYVGGLSTSLNLGKIEGRGNNIKDSSLGGIELGWTVGFPIHKELPLFIETGVNISSAGFDHEVDDSPWFTSELDHDFPRIAVPVNITYRHYLGDRMFVSPFVGILPNIVDMDYNRRYEGRDMDSFHVDTDPSLRFGFQAGVNFDYKWMHVGLAWNHFSEKGEYRDYGKDIKEKGKSFSINDIRLRVGVTLGKKHKVRVK